MSGRDPEADGAGRSRLDPAAFARALRSEAACLWAVAAGVVGDPAEAEDVVQEAAMIALGKLDEFDPGTSFRAWMGRFVRNVALNAARKRQRRGTRTAPGEVFAELEAEARRPAPRAVVSRAGSLLPDQEAFDDRVAAALAELPETARAALLLRTVLDLSYAEISRALEIPEGTAMSHVHRARTRMREALLAEEAAGEAGEGQDRPRNDLDGRNGSRMPRAGARRREGERA